MNSGNAFGKLPIYSSDRKYKINDGCLYNGTLYIALTNNAGNPALNTSDWKEFQGIQGDEGSQGPQGPNIGVQGPQGFTGIQGTQGIIGTQGSQGVQGIIGSQGNQGTQGNQGSQGTQGYYGPQGITIESMLLSATADTTITLSAGAWRTVPIGDTYTYTINDNNSNFNSTPTSNKLVVAKAGTYCFEAVVFANGCPTIRIYLNNSTEIGRATFDYQYGRTSICFSQETTCAIGDTIEIQTYSESSIVLLNSNNSLRKIESGIGTYLQIRAFRLG